MNGEIPSVPITTLAGISSLTDLLPEMPLPSPLPQTQSNKSLLFHPRVAEEANILLSLRDDTLVPQLAQSLVQTAALHIELKDHFSGSEHINVEQQLHVPELLKAILYRDPGIFNGFSLTSKSQQWNQAQTSCGGGKSSLVISPTSNHDTYSLTYARTCITRNSSNQDSPPSEKKLIRPLVIQSSVNNKVVVTSSVSNCVDRTNETKYQLLLNPTADGDLPISSCTPCGQAHPMSGTNLEESNMAPVTTICSGPPIIVPSTITNIQPSPPPFQHTQVVDVSNSFHSTSREKVKIESENENWTSNDVAKPENSTKFTVPSSSEASEKNVTSFVESSLPISTNARMAKPVVLLNRLSAEDQELMQKSLKAFAEKSPLVATKLGITKNHFDSETESEEEPKNKSKYFKFREKDRDNLKKRESAPKTKLRKVERKIVPVVEKLSVEELMETNTYQRFNRSIEKIFEDVEDIDVDFDDGDCPSEALIPKYQLQDLCSEAAKLKTLSALESIPTDRTIRLLTILEKNIRDGTKVSPISDPNDGEDERKLFMELAMERVMRAVDASLTALYILTSPNMHKQVYLEDVIDRIVIFAKYQLHNTIYPAFDPVYRIDDKDVDVYLGSGRKKRGHYKEVREKSVLTLYNKLAEVVSLLAELLDIQRLTDNAVLHASSMGISPFFVEGVNDLQLSALKLVTTIFTKYEKHRKLLLDDILASMARLPSSKRSLRSYRLSSEEYIQMLTALVLQLVHCMVVLPHNLEFKQETPTIDPDVVIVNKFKAARTTASNFLYVFLAKCSSKSEEIDYRPLFENFVQDLLTTVNKPEWPAAELMLSVLGNLLVNNFVNKSLEMSLRVASLDYLGVVAARLRKDAVTSHLKLSAIDQIIKEIKAEEMKDEEGNIKCEVKPVENDEERTQFLQRVLLDYLAMRGQTEPILSHARHFYIAQWYQDNCQTVSNSNTQPKQQSKRKRKNQKKESSDDESSCTEEEEIEKEKSSNTDPIETFRQLESRKKFLLNKIRPFEDAVSTEGSRTHILQTYIDYDSAELVARYLASKRPFSQSFDTYLKHILKVLTETSVLIRTKAMKCLTSIVEVDPGVLGLKEMQLGVSHSFLDHSTSVREAAVDLVGKFILSRPELITKYYDMLSARILDTGVSVRKRVIKILKDVCIECPDFPKIPEICVKIIRRVNDEDGIRKLVLEVFQNMWFTPVRERPILDSDSLVRKVMNITDVVAASNDISIEWFEQLLLSLFKPREDKDDSTKAPTEVPRSILVACQQIVDCLVETVLRLDGIGGNSHRLVSCLLMLYLFAKIRPQLLVHHATTLQPYLSLKCQTHGDYQMISCVARTLELVVPLIEHPSEMFLARLEEDSVKLMMQQDPSVVLSCVSCLGSIVNNVTRNFALIRDCLKKYHGFLLTYRQWIESGQSQEALQQYRPSFRRSLFVVGLLLRFFDFTDKDVLGNILPESIRDDVFKAFSFFLNHDEDSQHYTLKAIGNMCIRHYDLMLGTELKTLYHKLLTEENAPLQMKVQVLNNIESYLQEEERRMIKHDQEWAKLSKQENLKEMGDVSSGMASTIIQLYMKEVLESFLHPHVSVRNSALRVIQLILAQGLVHPVQIVPYLICMSTDEDKTVSNSADKQLQEIEKKYPGFIHMKAQSGIRLSYNLQKILQMGVDVIRGFRCKEGEPPGALNGFLYSTLRTKQQRRALVMSILKQFDEQVKTSLSQMLYLADNMAYFPYQVQDEPLFIIHHIDIIISVTGTNLLQSFREALIPDPNEEKTAEDDEDEDEVCLLRRLPEDTTALQQCLTASQGCLLLLVLKQHLKTQYGFNDAKITQYSPTESAKVYDKAVNKKCNCKFNPKATLQKLKQGTPPSNLDEEARKALVSEYLEFKTLIMNLDPDDADDTDDAQSRIHTGDESMSRVREVIAKKIIASELNDSNNADGTSSPKVPKLTIIPPKGDVRQNRHKNRKTERHKKHHHKRKRKLLSSDDSDTETYSDPDFLLKHS